MQFFSTPAISLLRNNQFHQLHGSISDHWHLLLIHLDMVVDSRNHCNNQKPEAKLVYHIYKVENKFLRTQGNRQ
jgi:hypothetical protein